MKAFNKTKHSRAQCKNPHSAGLLCRLTGVEGVMHRMKIEDFPEQVTYVLKALASEKNTDSIWFIGSRANGTEHESSDWDFIAFVSDDISERTVRHDQVDIIRVDRNWNYLLEGKGMENSGLFKTWRWREVQSGRARYTVRVTPQIKDGETFDIEDVKYFELLGINIWQRNT